MLTVKCEKWLKNRMTNQKGTSVKNSKNSQPLHIDRNKKHAVADWSSHHRFREPGLQDTAATSHQGDPLLGFPHLNPQPPQVSWIISFLQRKTKHFPYVKYQLPEKQLFWAHRTIPTHHHPSFRKKQLLKSTGFWPLCSLASKSLDFIPPYILPHPAPITASWPH